MDEVIERIEAIAIDVKCSKCKRIVDMKASGDFYKRCNICRESVKKSQEKTKCIHNIRKELCILCDGSAICVHKKRKERCKDCEGGSICSHKKIRSKCRDCNGSAFCIHDKQKNKCILCGGISICVHNKRKEQCKDCNLKNYLVYLQRKAMNRCFKKSKLIKDKHSIEYLNISNNEFIDFFQKKMDNWNNYSEVQMSWDNIHIDHIRPVSSFNLDDEEDFKACCDYTNLQPLIAVDNLEKSAKWNETDNIFWENNIKNKPDFFDIYIPSI